MGQFTFLETSESKNITSNCDLFRRVSSEVANLAAQVGIQVVPFYNSSLKLFSQLKYDQQNEVIGALNVYLNIHKLTKADGESILNSSRVVWNALIQLGFKPTADLFSFLTEGNVIEIHDIQYRQIFRSLSFFQFCSYSLEDLYCTHIVDLYERDINLETELMAIASKIYRGDIDKTIDSGLKPHIIREKSSHDRLNIHAHIKYLSPLYKTDYSSHLPQAIVGIEVAQTSMASTTSPQLSASIQPDNVIPLFASVSNEKDFLL